MNVDKDELIDEIEGVGRFNGKRIWLWSILYRLVTFFVRKHIESIDFKKYT
jgi:hypothetical protein